MAILKFSPVVSDARGSIGGVTFTRARGAAVARSRIAPLQPNSNLASLHRATHTTLIDDWRYGLSNAERIAWNDLALATVWTNDVGEQYTPTGWSLFLRANNIWLLFGGITVWAAPPTATCQQLNTYIEFTEAQDRYRLKTPTGGYPITDGWCGYYYSPDLPPSINHPKGPWLLGEAFEFFASQHITRFLLPVPIAFRPSVRFYKLRTATVDARISAPWIIRAYAPPEP